MNKPWYKSKTVWFNILTIGGAVLSGVAGLLPTIEIYMTPKVYTFVIFVMGGVNVLLRALTTGPINWSNHESANNDSPPAAE